MTTQVWDLERKPPKAKALLLTANNVAEVVEFLKADRGEMIITHLPGEEKVKYTLVIFNRTPYFVGELRLRLDTFIVVTEENTLEFYKDAEEIFNKYALKEVSE